MSRRLPLHLTLAFLLAGCSADSLTEPVQLSSGLLDAVGPVPFSVRCEMVIQPPTPVGPGLLHQIDTGTCHGTHIGRAQLTSDKIINVVNGTQTLETTFVAANGDELRGTGTGTNTPVGPGLIAFTATLTFDGGTGRFADASGQATITGQADLGAGRSHMTAKGSIEF
ncbi:MAG TPA: hypothetical protein VK912_08865 [Longimicrobiales bacterium]|nr:hypothetical protein [Longimicrobiales bacterium]